MMEPILENQSKILDAQTKAINELCIISIADCSGKITYANDLFCKISGYTNAELVGEPHSIINSGFHDKEFFRDMWETITAKKIWRGEVCNQAKGRNYYWVDSTIVPVFDNNGEIEQYICIRYEITNRKIAEQSLNKSFKMATLGEVSSCIAHEIKNPLAVISGKSSLLLSQLEKDNLCPLRLKKDLVCIEKTAMQIASIIDGISKLSRDDNNDSFKEVKMASIILDTLELCQNRFKKSKILIKTKGDLDAILHCRPVQISQVLLNLICNAIDAVENLIEQWIEIHISSQVNHIIISVTDSGKGISLDIVDRIMNPFFTTKANGKGTGLGLSISKKIIESHKGKLEYDTMCSNTRFNIQLPIKI